MTPLGGKRRFNDRDGKQETETAVKSEVKSEPGILGIVGTILVLLLILIIIKLDSSSRNHDNPKRKRKSRWGDENQKVILPGLPTTLSTKNKEQSEKYLRKFTHLGYT